jgi:hypothetical protein
MHNCRHGPSHANCQPYSSVPTRLVSVGLDEQPVRLVHTAEAVGAGGIEHAALSYCWGEKLPLCTTTNIRQVGCETASSEVPTRQPPPNTSRKPRISWTPIAPPFSGEVGQRVGSFGLAVLHLVLHRASRRSPDPILTNASQDPGLLAPSFSCSIFGFQVRAC